MSRSDVIDVVPAERVIDALQLMKKPIDTIVDRAVGREVCLRDGRIKALVTGRIEKTNSGYAMTADLIDPADGGVVASVTDSASAAASVLPTITREAQRLKELFEERRKRIRGAVPLVQVSTSSLAALQLYSEAKRKQGEGRLQQAMEVNSRALVEDPFFASSWIYQAWLLKATKPPGREARDAADRALSLAEAVPEWERHYIRGAYSWLNGDYAASVPELETSVRLRPDSPGVGYLTEAYQVLEKPEAAAALWKWIADQRPLDLVANFNAAQVILRLRENPDEARPYINRVDELLTPERSVMPGFYYAARWRRMLPAYEAWKSGDMAGAQSIVDREAREIGRWPEAERLLMQEHLGLFYMTLGRLHDAERQLRESGNTWGLVVLADLVDDVPSLRTSLLQLKGEEDQYYYHLVKAGLIEQASARLEIHEGGVPDTIADITRAALELTNGSPEAAVRLLRPSLAGSKGHLSSAYQAGCELLTTALVRLNRRSEAITELERCATVPPRFFPNFNAGFWMKNQLLLADEYRAAGRIPDAERIDQQLRRLLVYTDVDNPLVVRLQQRGGESKETLPRD